MTLNLIICALSSLAFSTLAQGIMAPPPAPPMISAPPSAIAPAAPPPVAGATLFSIGEPTDEEQLFLELINRARANPPEEALRLANTTDPVVISAINQYGVDRELMINQFGTLSAAAPLSFEPRLIAAARAHTQYQFETAQQTHTGSGGSDLGARLRAVSYPFQNAGENVYSYANSVFVGHAGFQVDWGVGPGGMQTPPGHRLSIHNTVFTEVGIGVILGQNTVNGNTVGPLLVTQDFGRPQTVRTYLTGVAYYDINANDFYDLGEGMGGITVTVDGVDEYAVTAASGGFSVPVMAGGTYTIRFNGANMAEVSRTVTAGASVKVDLKRPYTPPAITGSPGTPFVNAANRFTFSPTEGSVSARVRASLLSPLPTEGGEGLFTHMDFTTSGDYSFTSTAIRASGIRAFRLAHTSAGRGAPQMLTFLDEFYVRPNARVDFQSRLGIAAESQLARVQVSNDNGATWTSIYSQAGNQIPGTPDSSEQTFTLRSGSLAGFAGQTVKIRFRFEVNNQFFAASDDRFGWYFDDIQIINAERLGSPTVFNSSSGAEFRFTPTTAGLYLIDLQPLNLSRALPRGPGQVVTIQGNPPTLVFTRALAVAQGSVTLAFDRTAGTATPLVLQSAPDPAGPWSNETSAQFSGPVGTRFTVTAPAPAGRRFFRVATN